MTEQEKIDFIEQIKKDVCRFIGCSGLSQKCITEPQNCQIVRKLYLSKPKPNKTKTDTTKK